MGCSASASLYITMSGKLHFFNFTLKMTISLDNKLIFFSHRKLRESSEAFPEKLMDLVLGLSQMLVIAKSW